VDVHPDVIGQDEDCATPSRRPLIEISGGSIDGVIDSSFGAYIPIVKGGSNLGLNLLPISGQFQARLRGFAENNYADLVRRIEKPEGLQSHGCNRFHMFAHTPAYVEQQNKRQRLGAAIHEQQFSLAVLVEKQEIIQLEISDQLAIFSYLNVNFDVGNTGAKGGRRRFTIRRLTEGEGRRQQDGSDKAL
jgi:hypothetical protein